MSDGFVNVRFEPAQKRLIRQVCHFRGEDLSSFIRRSVFAQLAQLGYLSGDQARALGVIVKT